MSMTELTHQSVQSKLKSARYGRSLSLLAETGSTNDDGRAAALSGAPDGHVIVAESQTKGRGSRGRSWDSPAGQDLYLSVVAHVPLTLGQLPPLTLAVGLAVAETAEAFLATGQRATVKWPNDIWIERRKCAGILVESVSLGQDAQPVVIGVGLNVNRRTFSEELGTQPTSLALAGGLAENLDRAEVLAGLLDHLEHWVDRYVTYGPAPVVRALDQRLALRAEPARCDEIEGVVVGVSPEGGLLFRTPEGMRTIVSGTLRPAD
jgi:BirA family biotin operon repressor/biotin-[acetyl-CoA-carboxylase] ligase